MKALEISKKLSIIFADKCLFI